MTPPAASVSRVGRAWRRVVLTLLAASPLFFLPGLFFPFVVPRALLVYGVAELCLLHLVVLGLLRDPVRRATSEPFLWLLAAFVAWSLAGAVAGDAPVRSLFGNYERMEGVWRWLHLGLVFLWLRAVPDRSDWRYFWRVVAGVTALLAAVGVYQAHGAPWRLPVPDVGGGRVTATLGNPGYLAAWLLLALGPLALLARGDDRRPLRWAAAGAGIVALYALVLTGTRAAVGGLVIAGAAALAGAAVRHWRRADRRRAAWLVTGALAAAGAIAVAWAAGWSPEGAQRLIARTLEGEGLRSRFVAWGVALDGFPGAPVLGVGMENFRLLFGEHFDPSMYLVNPQATRWDRAHNLLLDRLTMTGGVGLVLYLGLWAVLLGDLRRLGREGVLDRVTATAFWTGLAAWGIFLLFWFEDHASLVLFLSIAAFLRHEREGSMLRFGPSRGPVRVRRKVLVGMAVVVLAGVGFRYVVQPGRAAAAAVGGARSGTPAPPVRPVPEPAPDTAGASSTGATSTNAPGDDDIRALERYERALDLTTVMRGEILGRYVATLERVSRGPRLRSPERAEGIARHVRRAAEAIEGRLAWDARNPLLYVRKGQLFTAAYRFFGRPELAETGADAFRRAIELNPRRIRYRHMLATAYLTAGRPGDARVQLDSALRIYPHFGETHYSYAAVHLALGDLEAAIDGLRGAIDRGYAPADTHLLVELLGRLRSRGEDRRAAELARAYLGSQYAAFRRSSAPGDDAPGGLQRVEGFGLRPADVPVAARLPVLYLRAGDPHNARATAQRLLIGLGSGRAGPETGERMRRVLRFTGDVASGRTERWREAESVLAPAPSGAGLAPPAPGREAPPPESAGGR